VSESLAPAVDRLDLEPDATPRDGVRPGVFFASR
jgi:hypothetical protein